MKRILPATLVILTTLATLHAPRSTLFAQSAAFTYQGRLADNGAPANGIYDLQFTIYDSTNNPGTIIAGPLTNSAVAVSNGLFTVLLDFGPSVFTGADRWLEIGVSPGGAGVFTTLVPRQEVTAAPYAIQALSASSVPAGTITSSMLAPNSAAENLLASGLSGVAGGGVVLSEQEFATNLLSQGYVRLAKVDLVPEVWRTLTNGPQLASIQVLGRRDHAAVWTGSEMIIWGGQDATGPVNTGGRYNPATDSWTPVSASNAPSPQISSVAAWTGSQVIVWGYAGPVRGGRYNPSTDSWTPISETNAPTSRTELSAVWTGTNLVVWGGFDGTNYVSTGARYDPAANLWSPTQTAGAPAIRGRHSAIWTGGEMIIWGGRETHSCGLFCVSYTNYNDGARYNPANNTWQSMTVASAPLGRFGHSAIWTGAEMIIWGGLRAEGSFGIATNLDSGARYNPANNQWTAATQTAGAPTPRDGQDAYWTGSRMLIWGGVNATLNTNFTDGAQYNPANNTWTALNNAGAPPSRIGAKSVWTGTQLLVFGGQSLDPSGTYSEIGRRYTLASDTWSPMTPAGDPSARFGHTAVWANTEMLGWGGTGTEYPLHSGGRLDPSRPPANMWSPIAITNAPASRADHTAVWTGTEMIVWGGFNNSQPLDSGGRYNAALNAWTTIPTAGAPTPRGRHTAVWTANRMVVWGGFDGTNFLATGGRYDPLANGWQSVTAVSAPSARANATAVSSGTNMIVWGGQFVSGGTTNFLNSGARYDPVADAWQPLPTSGAPAGRFGHTAVWTGNEMIVWGGETQTGRTNSGARYQPLANQWTALPMIGAPASRSQHTAVWAASQMIVWGGFDGANELASGGRYDLIRDTWNAMTTTNAPPTRQRHTAVWSGTEMIVWAGRRFNGVSDVFLDDAYAYSPPRTLYLYLRP